MNNKKWRWPQWTMFIFLFLSTFAAFYTDGIPRNPEWSAAWGLVDVLFIAWILEAGRFWR